MSDTLTRIKALVSHERIVVSDYDDEELHQNFIDARDAIHGLGKAELIEDDDDTGRGPSVLVLELDRHGQPIHVVWDIGRNAPEGPAVLIPEYQPDPVRWSGDFKRRLS